MIRKSTFVLFVTTVLAAVFVNPVESVGVRGLKKKKSSIKSRVLQKGGTDKGGKEGGDLGQLTDTIELLAPLIELASALCFSAFNDVDVLGATSSRFIDSIQVGDYVRDSPSSFSRVISLGHFQPSQKAQFLRIRSSHAGNAPIELTAKHIMFVKGKGAIPADMVRVGDELFHGNNKVTDIDLVTRHGVYAPITESGNIMVGGVLASSYAQFFDDNSLVNSHLQNTLTHFFFAPQRMVCTHVNFKLCRNETFSDADGYTHWFYWAIRAKQMLDRYLHLSQNTLLQSLFTFVVAVPLLSIAYVIEQMMLSPVVSIVLLGTIYYKHKTNQITKTKRI